MHVATLHLLKHLWTYLLRKEHYCQCQHSLLRNCIILKWYVLLLLPKKTKKAKFERQGEWNGTYSFYPSGTLSHGKLNLKTCLLSKSIKFHSFSYRYEESKQGAMSWKERRSTFIIKQTPEFWNVIIKIYIQTFSFCILIYTSYPALSNLYQLILIIIICITIESHFQIILIHLFWSLRLTRLLEWLFL